ncbi:MAG: hypothetical protein JWR19_1971 [Pedosphaera sp.]|nr:hypothetical protein [Pedosphaera sp.]
MRAALFFPPPTLNAELKTLNILRAHLSDLITFLKSQMSLVSLSFFCPKSEEARFSQPHAAQSTRQPHTERGYGQRLWYPCGSTRSNSRTTGPQEQLPRQPNEVGDDVRRLKHFPAWNCQSHLAVRHAPQTDPSRQLPYLAQFPNQKSQIKNQKILHTAPHSAAIPTGLNHPAQGCEHQRATLGTPAKNPSLCRPRRRESASIPSISLPL